MTKNDKTDKMTKNFFQKTKIVQKRISQKNIKNYQKLNKEQNDDQPTDQPI